ncbi:hypothetical protein GOP47_0023799 [Adiantum capillus-veneris]|uniref:Uncharacterized protein n=1 Tax=Adiantum capillus-veneris TaxID=13818 RepID=A0A9D4U460_ADICA|nr:hypothetical protein GOP47_0023799 [Adiantum capillus-veneris]
MSSRRSTVSDDTVTAHDALLVDWVNVALANSSFQGWVMVSTTITMAPLQLPMATHRSKATTTPSPALADLVEAFSVDAWRRCVAAGWWTSAVAASATLRASSAARRSLRPPMSFS